MKTKIISLFLCIGMLVACNNQQKGAAIGAGGGALLGGIIGAIAGNTAVGAAVGGAVGAGAGAIIGKKMDKAKAEAEAIKDEIKRELETRETEELVCGQYIIRYANILTQRLDTTSFKKALPDVYTAFIKQSASRRFTITA